MLTNENQTSYPASTQASTQAELTHDSGLSNQNDQPNKQNKTTIKEKSPRIHIFDVNPNQLIDLIKSELKIIDFKVKGFYDQNK